MVPRGGVDDREPGPDGPSRWRSWWRGILVLAGLTGVAITQPTLDLLGSNPQFFVSGRYTRSQIVGFAMVVTLAPVAVVSILTGLGWLVHASAGRALHVASVFMLSGLFGLGTLSLVGVETLPLAVLGAVALGGSVAWLECRRPTVRTFLSYLALGNLAFVALFLFASPTAELISSHAVPGARGSVTMPPLRGPVVMIIFDELPVTTLMGRDGAINGSRFPNFARLAAASTWFRNASSRSPMTDVSVPAILTGRIPEEGSLPTHEDQPRSLFTLFGSRHPVNRYEVLTDMCPPSTCDPLPPGELRQALEDASVAYGHRVLPESISSHLPSVDHAWGGFGADLGSPDEVVDGSPEQAEDEADEVADDGYERWRSLSVEDRRARTQAFVIEAMAAELTTAPTINFAHVALPHYPWTLTPWGWEVTRTSRLTQDPTDPAYELSTIQRYQLHTMQAGAADTTLGHVMDRLQEVGAWDDALVVVTSDHGNGLLPPDFGRTLTERNREELLRVPLFIKAPGQEHGEVRDDVAQTIDVLPSVIDLLGAETDWEFDGRSLYEGSEPTVDPVVDPTVEPALSIAERHAAWLGGDDWIGLAAVGDNGDLVGRGVADLAVGDPSSLAWAPDDRAIFGSLPTEGGRVPQFLIGTVRTPSGDRPPELVVAINGTIAGVVGAYRSGDDGWRFTGFMGPLYREGANEVVAYEVERSGDGPVLHRVGEI